MVSWSATGYLNRVKSIKSLLRKSDLKLYRGKEASREFDDDVRPVHVFY